MNVVDLLKEQHRRADETFSRFEKARRNGDKEKVFDELARLLIGHDAMEREIFYPACEKAVGKVERLIEGVAEHGVVEFCLFRADKARKNEDFDRFVRVLREVWDHHVEEEENKILPMVTRKMDQRQQDQLTKAMMKRFEEAQSSDFRALLEENLQQVLAGKAKTAPRAKKKAAAKRPARPATARAGGGRKRTARGKAASGRPKRTTRRA